VNVKSTDKKYYRYSSENLTYDVVYKNSLHKFIKSYPVFISGLLFSLVIVYVLSCFIITPAEKKLLLEKETLLREFESANSKINDFDRFIQHLSAKDDSLYRVILGTRPLPASIKKAGFGGHSKKYGGLMPDYEDTLNSITRRIDILKSKVRIQDHSYEEILKIVEKKRYKMFHTPAIMPIFNKDLTGTGAGFGMRMHPILGIRRMHEGIDFYAKAGSEIYATARGNVKSLGYSPTFGKFIVIDHGDNVETLYGHLSKFNIKTVQEVNRGQVIGFVGNSGLSSGPHLHYEVHVNGKEVDPVNYFYIDLTPEQYTLIKDLSQREMYSMD